MNTKENEVEWHKPEIKMPIRSELNSIYSVSCYFKVDSGKKYFGWYRFDFEEWIVMGTTISFTNIYQWRYDLLKPIKLFTP